MGWLASKLCNVRVFVRLISVVPTFSGALDDNETFNQFKKVRVLTFTSHLTSTKKTHIPCSSLSHAHHYQCCHDDSGCRQKRNRNSHGRTQLCCRCSKCQKYNNTHFGGKSLVAELSHSELGLAAFGFKNSESGHEALCFARTYRRIRFLQMDSLDVTVKLSAESTELRELYEQLTAKPASPVICDGQWFGAHVTITDQYAKIN